MTLGPAEVLPLLGMVRNIDSTPKLIAGRFLGLSGDEVKVGIPSWALVVGALGLGIAAGVVLAPKVEMAKNSLKVIGRQAKSLASNKRQVFGRY